MIDIFYKNSFKDFKRFLIMALMSSAFSGCYTMNFYHDLDQLRPVHDGEVSSVSTLFASTQIGGPAELRTVCPSGISRIEIVQTPSDGLLHYMSFGMYSPQTIRAWCKRRRR